MDQQRQRPRVRDGLGVEPIHQPKTRVNWILVGAIVFAFILVLLPWMMGFRVFNPKRDLGTAAGSLDEDVVRAKAAGVPLIASDLAPDPPVLPSENAAPWLLKAYASWEKHNRPRNFDDELLVAIEDKDYKKTESILSEPDTASALALAKHAAEFPRCDFSPDFDLGADLLYPELSHIKTWVRLLAFRAECEAHDGDHKAAIDDLRSAGRLAQDAGCEPSLISLLIRISCDAIALQSFERCLGEAKSANDIQGYVSLLSTPRPPFDDLRILKGEAYMGIATFRNWDLLSTARSETIDPTKLRRSGMPDSQLAKAYMARRLEISIKVLSAARQLQNDPARMYARVTNIYTPIESRVGLSYDFEKMMGSIFGGTGTAELTDQAKWRTEKALAKVLLYRAVHGSFPATLEAAEATDIDPFNGQPLKYLRTANGVRIYSVGQDLHDDHGVRRQQLQPGDRLPPKTWDEVASYPAFSHPPVQPAPKPRTYPYPSRPATPQPSGAVKS